jgi:flagellar assembly factor FliW
MEVAMIIESKPFGYVDIEKVDIIHFPRGIYGFEEFHNFVVLKNKKRESNPFMWLQSTEAREPCFAVVDPHSFFEDYKPEISEEDARAISLASSELLRYLLVATVPSDVKNMYVNLKCPIIINSGDNTAMQIILENTDYPMRYYLLQKMEG